MGYLGKTLQWTKEKNSAYFNAESFQKSQNENEIVIF